MVEREERAKKKILYVDNDVHRKSTVRGLQIHGYDARLIFDDELDEAVEEAQGEINGIIVHAGSMPRGEVPTYVAHCRALVPKAKVVIDSASAVGLRRAADAFFVIPLRPSEMAKRLDELIFEE